MKHVRVLVVVLFLLIGAGSCSSSSATVEAASGSDETSGASETEPVAVPTAEPSSTPPPTAAPEPTESPEPTAELEPDEPVADDAETEVAPAEADDELSAAFVECLARSAAGDADLLEALIRDPAESYGEIDDAQLDTLAANAVECRFLEEALGPDDSLPCLNEQLTSDNGGRLLVALSSVAQERPVPEPLRPLFVDAMDGCHGAEAMADLILAEAESDPAMASAFDRDCLVSEFEQSGSMRTIWEQVAVDPTQMEGAAFDVGAEIAISATINCGSMGSVMAAAAAEEGLELSEESIACIDESAEGLDLTDATEEDFGIAMLACLSQDELGALFAG